MPRPKGTPKTGGRQRGTPNRRTAAVVRALAQQEELTAKRVLEELRRLAFSDIRGLFNEQGNLRPIQELTPEQAAAIASMEVVTKNVTAGDGKQDTVVKIKVWDKTRSLEMLAKHFALLTEKIEHSGGIDVSWQQ